MEENMRVLIKEYEKLKKENEKLQKENEKLKKDKEVCDEVLDYIVKGAEQVINEWGKEIE